MLENSNVPLAMEAASAARRLFPVLVVSFHSFLPALYYALLVPRTCTQNTTCSSPLLAFRLLRLHTKTEPVTSPRRASSRSLKDHVEPSCSLHALNVSARCLLRLRARSQNSETPRPVAVCSLLACRSCSLRAEVAAAPNRCERERIDSNTPTHTCFSTRTRGARCALAARTFCAP